MEKVTESHGISKAQKEYEPCTIILIIELQVLSSKFTVYFFKYIHTWGVIHPQLVCCIVAMKAQLSKFTIYIFKCITHV